MYFFYGCCQLVMSGSFVQVMDTFDAVTDLIHTNHIHNNPGGGEHFNTYTIAVAQYLM